MVSRSPLCVPVSLVSPARCSSLTSRRSLTVRRKLLTFVNPHTGLRGPVTDVQEYDEWARRKREGYVPEEVREETPYAKEELEGAEDEGDD